MGYCHIDYALWESQMEKREIEPESLFEQLFFFFEEIMDENFPNLEREMTHISKKSSRSQIKKPNRF